MALPSRRKLSKIMSRLKKSVISTIPFTLLYTNGSTSVLTISDVRQLQSKQRSRKQYSTNLTRMDTLSRKPSSSCFALALSTNGFWQTDSWKGYVRSANTLMLAGINATDVAISLIPWTSSRRDARLTAQPLSPDLLPTFTSASTLFNLRSRNSSQHSLRNGPPTRDPSRIVGLNKASIPGASRET